MTTETIPGQMMPLAWIVEPHNAPLPYITYKPEIAAKREKAGDIVTPYHSKKVIDNEDI